ncbi:MAG: hypothetical protein ACK48N_09935 [Planctomyces sp.]|jgi:hypothetical protein
MSSAEPKPADQPQQTENARLIFEQTMMLWSDQVDYASTLRDKRRTYAAGLALLAGFGVFRISFNEPAGEITTMVPWASVVLRIIVILAGIAFLVATIYLFTERGLFARGQKASENLGAGERAISLASIPRSAVDRVLAAETTLVWRYRDAKLRAAILALSTRNRRVSRRIDLGVFWMIAGYSLVLFAFMWYTLFA